MTEWRRIGDGKERGEGYAKKGEKKTRRKAESRRFIVE